MDGNGKLYAGSCATTRFGSSEVPGRRSAAMSTASTTVSSIGLAPTSNPSSNARRLPRKRLQQELPPSGCDNSCQNRSGDFELLVFTLHGVPTWEVRHKATSDSIRRDNLVANGTADTFEAAKAAAIFEANTRSPE
jgi:hypothetical protein